MYAIIINDSNMNFAKYQQSEHIILTVQITSIVNLWKEQLN